MSNPAGSSIEDLYRRHFKSKFGVSRKEFDDVKSDLRQVKNVLYLQNMHIEKILKDLEQLKA